MSTQYTLYGVEFSPYTGKVRAYMDYKQVRYREVFASAWQYQRVIKPRTGVTYIPIVITPEDQALQDSSVIIDTIEQRTPERSVLPDTPKQRLANLLLELYGDEWMVPMPSLHYRWSFSDNLPFIYQQFGSIALPWGPAFLQRMAGEKLSKRFSGYLPKMGISGNVCQAIEQRHEALLEALQTHFSQHPYLFGGRPSLGDFALFGPLYAHLYRDPAPGRLMQEKAPAVIDWINRLRSPIDEVGDWLADDEVPEAVQTILRMLFEDLMPLLSIAVERLADWAKENPQATRIPGALSGTDFKLLNASGSRMVLTAPIWKLQRPLFFYQSLEDKTTSDQLLEAVGGLQAMQLTIATPVTRRKNRVCLEKAFADR